MRPLAILLALAALSLLALMAASRLYRSLLPTTEAAPGGCGFLFACGLAVAALAGAAVWIWRRESEP